MPTKKPIVPGEEAKALNVAITKHIHEQMLHVATVEGVALSEAVRAALVEYIIARKAAPEFQQAERAWAQARIAELRRLGIDVGGTGGTGDAGVFDGTANGVTDGSADGTVRLAPLD